MHGFFLTASWVLALNASYGRILYISQISIVDINITRTIRIPTNDGPGLFNYFRPDKWVILTRTPQRQEALQRVAP